MDIGFPANWVVCIGYDRSVDFGLFHENGITRKDSDTACSSVDNEDDVETTEGKQYGLSSVSLTFLGTAGIRI